MSSRRRGSLKPQETGAVDLGLTEHVFSAHAEFERDLSSSMT